MDRARRDNEPPYRLGAARAMETYLHDPLELRNAMIYRNGFGYLRQIPDGQFAPWVATESSGEVSGAFYGPFGSGRLPQPNNSTKRRINNMLMRDSLTGYVHEVPEFGEAEPYGEMAYDGFGNPVGFFGRRRRRRRVSEPGPQAVPPAPEMGPEGGEQMPGSEEMGEVVYDGFGNPVGFSFKKLIRKGLSVAKRFAPLASLLPIPGAVFCPKPSSSSAPGACGRKVFPSRTDFKTCFSRPGVVQQFAPVAQAFQQAPREDIGGFDGEADPLLRVAR